MKYFLDTAVKEEINKWLYIANGITSNPALLKEADIDHYKFLDDNISLNIYKFVQIWDYNEAMKIKQKYHPYIDNIVFKVSMAKENFSLIEKLKEHNFLISATTCYDIWQINHAIELGCDFTMVYHHKNKDKDLMEKAYDLKQKSKSKINLVAASIRSKDEVERAIQAGMDYITIRPRYLDEVFYNEQLEDDLKNI